MSRGLWCRRVRFRGSKGVSSVIGAIVLVVVGLLISTNVFLWALSQNTLYSQKVVESHQLDADRFSERMVVSSGYYSVIDDDVQVNATLVNEGPVAVQIQTLWVVDATIDEYNFTTNFSANSVTNFNPGDSGRICGTVEIDDASPDHVFDIWFVTARGNPASFEMSRYVRFSNITDAIGPTLMKFNTVRWYSVQSGNSGTFEISNDEEKVIWSINFTNCGHQNIALSNNSVFIVHDFEGGYWRRGGDDEDRESWYIKEEYPLEVGKATTLSFCWDSPGAVGEYVLQPSGGGGCRWFWDLTPGTYAVTIILIGDYLDGRPYGQTIPFAAIRITD